jgi:CHAT domain-containing protein
VSAQGHQSQWILNPLLLPVIALTLCAISVLTLALQGSVNAAQSAAPARLQNFSALAALYDYPGEHPEMEKLVGGGAAPPAPLQAAIAASAEGEIAWRDGRYSDARGAYEKAFTIVKGLPNPDPRALGAAANNLGAANQDEGRYKDAEGMYTAALGAQTAPDDPLRAVTLANQASLLDLEGDYEQSETVFGQAISLMQAEPTPSAAALARALNNFGLLRHDEGDNRDAETQLTAALQIRQRLGVQSDIAETIDNLGNVYRATARYDQAKLNYETGRDLRHAALGQDHPDYAGSLNNLANYYRGQYDYGACGPLYESAAVIWRARLPAMHPVIGGIDKNLAALYDGQGDYGRAEEFYQLALAIRHQSLGERHPLYAATLRNLATFYAEQERYDLALPLYKQALAIEIAVLPPDAPDIAATMVSMGGIYDRQHYYHEAEANYLKALDMLRSTVGPDHVMVASAMADLGEIYADDQQFDLAEQQMRGALDIRLKRLGPNHPDVARSEAELADFYERRGRFSDAEPLLRDAIRIHQNTPGEQPIYVAGIDGDLAYVLAKEGRVPEARALFEDARAAFIKAQRNHAGIDDDTLRGLLAGERVMLARYAAILAEIAAKPSLDPKGPPAADAAFVVVEQAKSSAAQTALALAATRWAAANRNAAGLVTVVQALRNQRQVLSRSIAAQAAKPLSQRAPGALEKVLARSADVDRRLASASALLLNTFPAYDAIANPIPIETKDAVAVLKSDEALISFFTIDDGVMAWFLKRGRAPIYRLLPVTRAGLSDAIARLRASVAGPNQAYDVIDAHVLYKELLAPFAADLAGVTHLILVPDDVLIAVPFAALINSDQGPAFAELAHAYRSKTAPTREQLRLDYPQIAWLVKQPYATSEVPSATALGVLRNGSARKLARLRDGAGDSGYLRLIGVGDPALSGRCGAARGDDTVPSDLESVVDQIRDMPRLCGARQELLTEAETLDVPADQSLYIGKRATKPEVMELNRDQLARARVVVFATHALIGGAVSAVREPALVMTPPAVPTPQDNGLLSLTDILDLRLDQADWVILSACNTFCPAGSGEGFNGLARAFFHAGAPSILASQWSVDDQATRNLMTQVLAAYARADLPPEGFRRALAAVGLYAAPRTSRAAALRDGALALLAGEHEPERLYFSHPYAWAPFVVVGEGGPVGE